MTLKISWKFIKKHTAEQYSFLVNDTTLQSDNLSRFTKNLLKLIYNKSWQLVTRLKMKNKYTIDRKAAKISVISSDNIDKYKNLTGEEILPFNENQVIEQAEFIYSALRKSM